MATPESRRTARGALIEIAQTCILAVLVFVLISTFIGRFVVQQTSMEPNFHEGQRVIVSKIDSWWTDLFVSTTHASDREANALMTFQHGQIAVFYDSTEHTGDPLIKRVIGIPGDRVEIRDETVWLNGRPLAEPYLKGLRTACDGPCGPFTLGADEYYMLGDNRPVSRDSRSFGPVHADQFVGRVVLRYWPLDQMTVFR